MISLTLPNSDRFREATDIDIDEMPRVAQVTRERDLEHISDVAAAAREAVQSIGGIDDLEPGDEVAITAGSRGIRDLPETLSGIVTELQRRELEPFVLAAMGSHGGATSEGQLEILSSLGITESSVGCPVRASMDVEAIATDSMGRPVYASKLACGADAIVLVNRIKPHTDFSGIVESGLSKIAVIGLGSRRGAESLHNAALATDFETRIRDRASILFDETPIIGGVGLIENADDRATVIEGLDVEEIPDREPALLERAYDEIAMLPVSDLDLLIVDEIGKNISGTGMDTNVIGRYRFYGEEEPETPEITRIYVRSITPESHGNGIGIGLADYAHRAVAEELDLEDMYVNTTTGAETERAKIPLLVEDDRTAFDIAYSTTGVADPEALRFARIRNTMDPDRLVVSEPVARELESMPDVTVGPLKPFEFVDNSLPSDPYP